MAKHDHGGSAKRRDAFAHDDALSSDLSAAGTSTSSKRLRRRRATLAAKRQLADRARKRLQNAGKVALAAARQAYLWRGGKAGAGSEALAEAAAALKAAKEQEEATKSMGTIIHPACVRPPVTARAGCRVALKCRPQHACVVCTTSNRLVTSQSPARDRCYLAWSTCCASSTYRHTSGKRSSLCWSPPGEAATAPPMPGPLFLDLLLDV